MRTMSTTHSKRGDRQYIVGGTTTAYSPPDTAVDTMEKISIRTGGTATDIGNLLSATMNLAGNMGSFTRGVWAGGENGSGADVNVIQYMDYSSEGNATDFGDLQNAEEGSSASSSSTRGIIWEANSGQDISYITLATTGNATDFGISHFMHSSNTLDRYLSAGNTTISWCFNGRDSSALGVPTAQWCTIATTGARTTVGPTLEDSGSQTGAATSTKTEFYILGDNVNNDITASQDSGLKFNISTEAESKVEIDIDKTRHICVNNHLTALLVAGEVSSTPETSIDTYTFATEAVAADFGDLNTATSMQASASATHSGL